MGILTDDEEQFPLIEAQSTKLQLQKKNCNLKPKFPELKGVFILDTVLGT